MEKVIKDGHVAVVYSPGFGAGWYTWNTKYPELMFHPKIVEKVLENKQEDLTEEFVTQILNLPSDNYFYLSPGTLKIEWVPQGTRFKIDEYDGSESVKILSPSDGFEA